MSEQLSPCPVSTSDDASAGCEAPPPTGELEDDNVVYFIKKVIWDLKMHKNLCTILLRAFGAVL